MSPELWGKYAWNFIHFVTLDYPENPTEEDKRNYYQFFNSLQYVLPCAKCRNNLANHLKKYPLTDEALSSRKNLVKWAIDLHNVVNYYNGKRMLTYPEAMEEINKLIHPQKNKMKDIIFLVLLIIVIIILCYLVYRFFRNRKTKKIE